MSTLDLPHGMEITGPIKPGYETILTREALELVAKLHHAFDGRRKELLARRAARQVDLDRGLGLDFLPETAEVREGDWTIRGTPEDLQDRRVEITGPVDRKMVINALNSGASCFMADFEDASTPTWDNMIGGQINLRDANRREIDFTDEVTGKAYRLNERHAVLIVRPRGWHLDEAHVLVDKTRVSGSIFDFALYLFHNHEALKAKGSGPYYYLPKMEHHLEARLWNDVIVMAQEHLGLPVGTVKSTVLIETITAAFQMDEILHELRDHIVGLNCGRWDYIFSYIKKFRNRPEFVLPDRSAVGMTQPFMRAYSQLCIKTCHRRGAHAMGGMAAQIPIKGDEAANKAAMDKVRADKTREATDGHDGTWVAHPALVPIAKAVFDEIMPGANQIAAKPRHDVAVSAADLLALPEGPRTEAELRANIRVGLQYLEAWLRGMGCVPLYNLMEDAATAEISRAQIWQQLRHKARFDDGVELTPSLFETIYRQETSRFTGGAFDRAIELFHEMCVAEDFPAFLTNPAYEAIVEAGM